jgi:hypothetical protein
MKNKNKRELEKHWAKEAVKKAKPATKTKKRKSTREHEDLHQVAGRVAREAELVQVSQAAARLVGDVAVDN